ncbi:MAG TPA: ATP-grasp domain-containing protein [Bacillota bacterium]
MFTLLFTAIGRRVQLIRAFKESYLNHGIAARIIGTDSVPQMAPACYFCDASYQVPFAHQAHYVERILEICVKEKVNMVIPLFEPEFLSMDDNRRHFTEVGATLLLSKRKVLDICRDKYLTYDFFTDNNVNTPKTWIDTELPAYLKFPLFVKPRVGMGSAGAQMVKDKTHLHYILSQKHDLIVQEFISGSEYTLDVLASFDGKVLSVVPRQRLEVRCGEVSKSRTFYREDMIIKGKNIVEKLGAIGPVTLQCIDRGGKLYWTEINPRFGGGVPLSIKAGVDYPFLLYQLYKGQLLEPIIGRFKDNLKMIRYDEAIYF